MASAPGNASGRRALLGAAVLAVVAAGWLLLRYERAEAPADDKLPAAATLELAPRDVVIAEPRVLARRLPISGSLTQSSPSIRVPSPSMQVSTTSSPSLSKNISGWSQR